MAFIPDDCEALAGVGCTSRAPARRLEAGGSRKFGGGLKSLSSGLPAPVRVVWSSRWPPATSP